GYHAAPGPHVEPHERGLEPVRARRHPDPVPRPDVVGYRLLERRDLRAHDELLGLEDAVDGLTHLIPDRRVLRLEIEQRYLHRAVSSSVSGWTRSPSLEYPHWQSGQTPRLPAAFSRPPHSHIHPAIRAGAPSIRA